MNLYKNLYQYLHHKRNMSKINASRLVLILGMISWFVIGATVGALIGAFIGTCTGTILPEMLLSWILNMGSLCSILIGFVYQMIRLLQSVD